MAIAEKEIHLESILQKKATKLAKSADTDAPIHSEETFVVDSDTFEQLTTNPAFLLLKNSKLADTIISLVLIELAETMNLSFDELGFSKLAARDVPTYSGIQAMQRSIGGCAFASEIATHLRNRLPLRNSPTGMNFMQILQQIEGLNSDKLSNFCANDQIQSQREHEKIWEQYSKEL